MMYTEFKYLIKDYFSTLRFKEFVFEWIFPFILGSIALVILYLNDGNSQPDFDSAFITLLGILIGFSIAMLTVITTSSNKNIDRIKKEETKYIIDNVKVTLFRLFVINIGYSIIMEIFLLIFNIFIPIILCSHNIYTFSFSVFLIIHILFVNVRTVTNFYFIETATLK